MVKDAGFFFSLVALSYRTVQESMKNDKSLHFLFQETTGRRFVETIFLVLKCEDPFSPFEVTEQAYGRDSQFREIKFLGFRGMIQSI